MKLHFSNKILGLIGSIATLLIPSACSDNTFNEFNETLKSDEVSVSFTIAPEAAAISTRAVNYPDENGVPRISDGSKADMLIYSVYEAASSDLENDILLVEYGGRNDFKDDENIKVGDGQNLIKVDKFPYVINLTFKKGIHYRIAFWAQNSKCKAYETRDLRKVEVFYSELDDTTADSDGNNDDGTSSTPNNDENRDAFCRSIDLDVSSGGNITKNIYLYRPFAQINIGTNGYDFEIVNRERPDNDKYIYSKIRINNVARYLNVVKDKVYHSTTTQGNVNPYTCDKSAEAFSVVDFAYSPIPAYNNYEQVPEYPTYTKWDWIYNPSFSMSEIKKEDYDKEEFLQVHHSPTPANWINAEKVEGFYPYANLNNHPDKDSETFKYLSMCYVLTSSTQDKNDVIDDIVFWVAKDVTGKDEFEVFSINNVPAQRNWRTNIIGNLLSVEKQFTIMLDTDFAGESSAWKNGDEWEWSGPLAKGVYYDAQTDEIQISSREGLIWFQKMVNGTMRVREGEKEFIDQKYPYYKVSATGVASDALFDYEGISAPSSDPQLQERILRATHQLYNQNYDPNNPWPKYGFHFVGDPDKVPEGMKPQATVKLMADIDLFGEEWIPIGFDGRMGEQVGFTVDEAGDREPSNRVFYGIFDGNNHTIYNLATKRFNVNVHDNAQQIENYKYKNLKDGVGIKDNSNYRHPTDNPQWWGRGFFGQIGGEAEIKNLNLYNVDITGCNGVGGIAGIAYGGAIKIINCAVEGGNILATPMYRGDEYRKKNNNSRTFARGVYLGGIVGFFNTRDGIVEDCVVKNIVLQGVRRVGGLIGSINSSIIGVYDGKEVTDEGKWMVDNGYQAESKPKSISNNRIENTILIASSYSNYGLTVEPGNNPYNQIGFGYNINNLSPYSNEIVGGADEDIGKKFDNIVNNLTYARFPIDANSGTRISSIGDAPLQYLPMLSTWYADEIDLYSNYYGEPSAYTHVQMTLFQVFTTKNRQTGYESDNTFNRNIGFINKGGNTFYFPMAAPYSVDINYDKTSGHAGVFVECVKLNGGKSPGGQSVITPVNITKEGDCAMYVAARSRMQFNNSPDYFRFPTEISNIVVRGEPFAYNGILFAPNVNMGLVTLSNVAVYDCYKTLALDDWLSITSPSMWPNQNNYSNASSTAFQPLNLKPPFHKQATPLELIDCNLRGFTDPGAHWMYITYTRTTFGQGAYIKEVYGTDNEKIKESYTCKVETKTTFDNCFFKAPYIIEKAPEKEWGTEWGERDDKTWAVGWTFKNKCMATATTTNNVELFTEGNGTPSKSSLLIPSNCSKIVIDSDAQGNPKVEFYDASGNLINQ